MGLEGFMLSEISQRKTNKVWFQHVRNQSQKNQQVIKSRVLNTKNKQEVTDQRGMREERNR